MGNFKSALIEHYIKSFGKQYRTCAWEKGPTELLPPNFCVVEFAPSESRGMWTYATVGMSCSQDSNMVEVHIFSSVQDEGLVELLTTLAFYHTTKSKLDLNHTVNLGQPWQGESKCTFGLISLPYLDGPMLEDFKEGKSVVKCYWLVPITEKERDFKQYKGIDALESKIEEANFNYLNPVRESVV